MYRNNIFQICLIVSVFLHLGLILPWPFLNIFSKSKLATQNIDLVYLKGVDIPDIMANKPRPVHSKNPAMTPKRIEAGRDKRSELAKNYDIDIPPKGEVAIPVEKNPKKEEDAKNAAEIKNNLPEEQPDIVDIGTQKGAVYEKYYLDVRNKIKSIIEKNKRGLFKESEIYVRFILDRNGVLKNVSLYKASGSEAANLERLTIKSIKEAAPFPPFMDKMKESELQFNLPIRVIRKN